MGDQPDLFDDNADDVVAPDEKKEKPAPPATAAGGGGGALPPYFAPLTGDLGDRLPLARYAADAVSAVRHRDGEGSRAAARGRWSEAGAVAHPLFAVGDGRPRQHAAQEIRARGRRRARQVPPARRRIGVRRARAPGAGLDAALSAHRRRGQLRLPRRRRSRGDALHGIAADEVRRRAARRARSGHRRLRAELRRQPAGAAGAAGAAAGGAAQWRVRHRGRHGDRDPEPQSHRSRERGDRAHPRPEARSRRHHAARSGARTFPAAVRSSRRARRSRRPMRPDAARSACARAGPSSGSPAASGRWWCTSCRRARPRARCWRRSRRSPIRSRSPARNPSRRSRAARSS